MNMQLVTRFKQAITGSVLVLTSSVALLNSAIAEEYYVSEETGSEANDGLSADSPLKFVRTAGNKTRPGDTVYILPGTYKQMGATNAFDMLYVPNSGREGEYITYSGVLDAEGNRPVIESSALTAITLQTKSYVIIENLEIVAAATDYLDVQNTIGGWAWDRRSGVGIQNDSHNIIIRNCFIHDLPGGGIGGSDSDVVLIEDNIIEHTSYGSILGNSGISLYKMTEQANAVRFPEWPDHDIIIRNNVSRYNVNLKGTQSFDFALTDGNGIIIDDFKHTQGDESEAFEGSSLIIGNLTYGNGAGGINVFQTNNAEIYHNTSFDNGQSRRISSTPVFDFNMAYQPIQVGGASNVTVENNIFTRGDDQTSLISLFWNDDTVTITNNIFWNEGGTLTTSDVPAGNIIADPEFVNVAPLTQAQTDLLATASWDETTASALLRYPTKNNGFPVYDFNLSATSPAIDAGVALGSVVNYAPVNGSAADLGAVEFTGVVVAPTPTPTPAPTPVIPDYDYISNVDVIGSLTAGDTALLQIDYAAQTERDLLLILADANSNYRWVAWVRHSIPAGDLNEVFELNIPASAPKHGNYKLEVLMVETDGWHSKQVASWSSANNTVN